MESDEVVPVLNLDEFSRDGVEIFGNSLKAFKENYYSDKPKITKLVINGRDLRLVQQAGYLSNLQGTASNHSLQIYIIPVDQNFKKGQELHVPVQYMSGTKKDTLETISKLSEELAGEVYGI